MIVEKIRSWLVRNRDTSNVTYSRFGRPGDPEQDDKPPPSTILVEPFNENDQQFILLNCWHVQKASAAFACFGLSMVILTFISSFFEFGWYSHSKGVDIAALLFMFVYLALGVLIHYYVLYAIKKQNPNFMLPFITVYTLICSLESVVILTIIFRTMEVSPQERSQPFFMIMVGTIITVAVQLIMLFVVIKCRQFLAMKVAAELEMKVAEKSKIQYPGIRIVFAGPTAPGINNPNSEHNDIPTMQDPTQNV
ncbi:hypothetical protein M3Y97_00338800 [Aphelenchoides bicaudatus]|nr:hypothetical protein M3Y97_00338800 [Aphelenchoides bicaudatus]